MTAGGVRAERTPSAVSSRAPRHAVHRRSWLRRNERGVLWVVSVALFFGGWEAYVRLSGISRVFLPAPSAIVATARQMLATPEFQNDIAVTALEFAAGFALALLVGIPVGLVVGWYRRVFFALNPFIVSLYAMPRVALLPWVLLWVGIGLAPKVVLVFIGAVLPLTVNVLYGVRTVDSRLVAVASSFQASRSFMFLTIVLPAVVPFLMTGVRIAIGAGLIMVIVAELQVASAGIGFMMNRAGHALATERIFVGLFVLAGAAMTLMAIAGRLEARFQRWRPR